MDINWLFHIRGDASMPIDFVSPIL